MWNVRNAGRAGKEPLEAGEMEVGTARGRPPSPGQQRRLLPWEEKELGRRPRRPKATWVWRVSRSSETKSARWRRGAPTVTDRNYQTMQPFLDQAALEVLDFDPCVRSVTRGATQPKGRKGRRPGRKRSPEAQRGGRIADANQPIQILHHPEKQVAVADLRRNHQANRHEAVCETRMDNPSPREACVGLPSRPRRAEKRKNGEASAWMRVGRIWIVRALDGS